MKRRQFVFPYRLQYTTLKYSQCSKNQYDQSTEWQLILSKHVSHTRVLPSIYKELFQLSNNNNKKNQPNFKMGIRSEYTFLQRRGQ